MRIAVTVDVENDLGFLDSRLGLEEGLPTLLAILDRHGVRGTFFVSGESLDFLTRSGYLGEIANRGHEVGSHGYRHADYREWEYGAILEEVRRSKLELEESLNMKVVGFRAPQFLMSGKTFRAIQEAGYLYDSSFTDPDGFSAARLLRKVRIDEDLLAMASRSHVREFAINSLPLLKVPHGLLWINTVTLPVYRLLFPMLKKDLVNFYLHPFDLIGKKDRVPLSFTRKAFYLRNMNGIPRLLDDLISFWAEKKAGFTRLDHYLLSREVTP